MKILARNAPATPIIPTIAGHAELTIAVPVPGSMYAEESFIWSNTEIAKDR